MYSATAVANEFLKIARDKGDALTSMKLQKLVYYAHGWSLALSGKPLIFNQIQAWDYGPVIPELYKDFKNYGNGPITELACEWEMRGRSLTSIIPTLGDLPSSPERDAALKIIDRVWQLYGGFTAAKLSNATHAPGTPWEQVYRPGERSIVIPDSTIKTYFEGLLDVQ